MHCLNLCKILCGKKVKTMKTSPEHCHSIEEVRQYIDGIDEELLKLFNLRASYAQAVARIKQSEQGNTPTHSGFYRPEREAQVLKKVQQNNAGPLSKQAVALLFRELMSHCLALEEPTHVAFLGPKGTFTQQAAIKHFGHAVSIHSQASIAAVFREVESGNAQYGVVPVENSTEGVVTHTLDNFVDSNLHICGEVELRIHHNLMAKNTELEPQKVYSHAQSLAQCRLWLDEHYPSIERIGVNSNAKAAKLAAKEEQALAIAPMTAAELYDLQILAKNIEDRPDNSTRFLVIGKPMIAPSGEDKTSILVAHKNEPGALYKLLKPFHDANIELTRLETRPAKSGTWNYVFYIDFEGHQQEPHIAEVLAIIRSMASDYKCLGSYPKSVI